MTATNDPFGTYLYHLLRNWAFRDQVLCRCCDLELLSLPVVAPASPGSETFFSAGLALEPGTELLYQATQLVLAKEPDLVAFSAYMWNITGFLAMAHFLKQRDPGITTIIGGPEAYGAANAQQILVKHPQLDFAVFSSEGEEAFHALLRHLYLHEGRPEEVPFLAYRDGKEVRVSNRVQIIENLDDIPSPVLSQSRDELLAAAYGVIRTSRGCPFRCSFCAWPTRSEENPTRVRSHSVERVIEELEYLRRCGLTRLTIVDAIFGLQPAVAIPVLEYLRDEYRECVFAFEQKVDSMSDGVLELVCELVSQNRIAVIDIGLQSSAASTLALNSRRHNKARFERNLKKLGEAASETPICIDLMVGLPGDTLATFMASLDYVFNEVFGVLCPPSRFYCAPLSVLPGTTLRHDAGVYGLHFELGPPHAALQTGTMPYDELRRARVVVAAMDFLAPVILMLRSNQIEVPALSTVFTDEHFTYTERWGWHDLAAHGYFAISSFRRRLLRELDHPHDQLVVNTVIDITYLCSAKVDGSSDPALLALPSRTEDPWSRVDAADEIGTAKISLTRRQGSCHFKFQDGELAREAWRANTDPDTAPVSVEITSDEAAHLVLDGSDKLLLGDSAYQLYLNLHRAVPLQALQPQSHSSSQSLSPETLAELIQRFVDAGIVDISGTD